MKLNDRVLGPIGMLEPLVPRRLCVALPHQEHALGRVPPNRHALVEQVDLRVRHRDRVAHHFRHEVKKGAAEGRGVAHPDLPDGGLSRQEPLHEPLTLASRSFEADSRLRLHPMLAETLYWSCLPPLALRRLSRARRHGKAPSDPIISHIWDRVCAVHFPRFPQQRRRMWRSRRRLDPHCVLNVMFACDVATPPALSRRKKDAHSDLRSGPEDESRRNAMELRHGAPITLIAMSKCKPVLR